MKSSTKHGSVLKLRGSQNSDKAAHWHRKVAIQIAAQLPDDPDDALTVLSECETLVKRFLCEP